MAQRKLTYDDYLALPDDGKRYELIDGELVELSSPSERHQARLGWLYLEFGIHLRAHGGGRVYFAPLDVTLSDHNTFQPDLLFIADRHADRILERRVLGAPTLAVEIASPSTAARDMRVKRWRYHEFGVEEFWAVLGDLERVEVFTGDYRTPRIIEPPDVLSTPLLPGFEISTTDLFA